MGGVETLEGVVVRVLRETRLTRSVSPFVLAVAYGLRLRPMAMDGAELREGAICYDQSAPPLEQRSLVALELSRAIAADAGLVCDGDVATRIAVFLGYAVER